MNTNRSMEKCFNYPSVRAQCFQKKHWVLYLSAKLRIQIIIPDEKIENVCQISEIQEIKSQGIRLVNFNCLTCK